MDEMVRLEEQQRYQTGYDTSEIKDRSKQQISFSGKAKNCCVGVVDAVDSTKITATLQGEKMCEYYRIFLNWMAIIAQDFGAIIVKNVGDSLLYYFPETEDGQDKNALRKVLDCNLAMIESHPLINGLMRKCGLPPLQYRVSSDYGRLTIAKSANSDHDDIFGSTVNVCTKMNRIALPNHIVVGGDLHQLVKSFKEYGFGMIAGYSLGLKFDYPVYTLFRTKDKHDFN